MADTSKPAEKKASSKAMTPEEIVQHFQNLRDEQRQLTSKLSQFELDLTEHKMVVETLKNVQGDRRCFRLIGGILTERTVKDILPTLQTKQQMLKDLVESMHGQITKKGKEINEFRKKYNIRFGNIESAKQEKDPVAGSSSRGNVLVS